MTPKELHQLAVASGVSITFEPEGTVTLFHPGLEKSISVETEMFNEAVELLKDIEASNKSAEVLGGWK
jgi:hypothetical protein